jgi:plastocyanin
MKRLMTAVLISSAAAFLAAGCGGSSDSSTAGEVGSGKLMGSVGPGFEISMDQTTAAAGDYELTVNDESDQHNFHLTGPGDVDVMTEVGSTGEETFTVTLEPGTYTFVCDPHASSMKGTLTVE